MTGHRTDHEVIPKPLSLKVEIPKYMTTCLIAHSMTDKHNSP